MICKLTKEEAAAMNALSDQAYSLITGAIDGAGQLVMLSNVSDCIKTGAMVQAVMNHLMRMLLAHRRAHGQMSDVPTMTHLRKNPEAFEKLASDLNEELACVLRGLNPEYDFMLHLLKMDKQGKKK